MISKVQELAIDLIRRPSVTPDDAGCQQLIFQLLETAGFTIEWFNQHGVTNCLISHGDPQTGPSLMFLGHTDVVPVGAESSWTYPPFAATSKAGFIYGRGAADMKGSVAAMVVALQRFVEEFPQHHGCVQLLLTSDEEGSAQYGTRIVAEALSEQGRSPDYCLVGEPSSSNILGDVVRVGRRGSINATLRIEGVQGHTAFADKVDNPAHKLAAFIAVVCRLRWDEGDVLFPPSTLQVSALDAGGIATNVTPATAEVKFNIRNGPISPQAELKQKIETILEDLEISSYQLQWQISAEPFYTPEAELSQALGAACKSILGHSPEMNTGGGTSDGRFIAPLGTQVVELGPLNHSIHKVDEHVAAADLDLLMAVYFDTARRLLK